MAEKQITLISDSKKVNFMVASNLYASCLEEKLELYKEKNIAKSPEELDKYLKKKMSVALVTNELSTGIINGRNVRKKSKNSIITEVAEQTGFPILAISWLYDIMSAELGDLASKKSSKDLILTHILNDINILDLYIEETEDYKAKAALMGQKTALLDKLAQLNDLYPEKKGATIVSGQSVSIDNRQLNNTTNNVMAVNDEKQLFQLAQLLIPKKQQSYQIEAPAVEEDSDEITDVSF